MQLTDSHLSEKQIQAIATSNNKINIWHGAVRSGKTYSSLLRFLIEIKRAPPGEMVIICRDAHAFRRNILPVLYELVNEDVRYLEGKNLLEIWDRKIHVVGAHDSRSEGKLRGATFRGAYVDEATLIPHSAFIVLVQRCAMGGARIFATTNPDSPGHWLKKEFLEDNPDVNQYPFTMLDNPALTEEEREYLERQHKGIFYKRFILGDWVLAEGAVFDFFDEKIHTIERPPANAQFYLCGVDIGFTNPTAFTLIGVNYNVSPPMWAEAEYHHDNKKQGTKTASDFANDLSDFIGQRPYVKRIYMDPAAGAFKAEIKRSGLGLPISDADNDVLQGITSLVCWLGNGELKICRNCKNLIREIQGYTWDPKESEKGNDEPIKRFDDTLDSFRYGTFSYFKNRIHLAGQQEVEARTLGYSNAPYASTVYPRR